MEAETKKEGGQQPTEAAQGAKSQDAPGEADKKDNLNTEEDEEEKEDKSKGHEFGAVGSKIVNSILLETFNPLKKFYLS